MGDAQKFLFILQILISQFSNLIGTLPGLVIYDNDNYFNNTKQYQLSVLINLVSKKTLNNLSI